MGQAIPHGEKKIFISRSSKLGTNEASAQGLQNSIYRTSAILNFWQSYGHMKIAILYGDCMGPSCMGKFNTNNLPAPTNLSGNHYGKKTLFFKDANQKSARVVPSGIWIPDGTTRANFWKMFSSSKKRGGADAFENDPSFRSKPTVYYCSSTDVSTTY